MCSRAAKRLKKEYDYLVSQAARLQIDGARLGDGARHSSFQDQPIGDYSIDHD